MICIKYAWKRLENYGIKIKYWFLQFMDSLDQKPYPNHSIHKPNANPNANNLPAALEKHNQTCTFVKKFKNWKHICRAFQDQITTPLACQGYQGPIPIKTIYFIQTTIWITFSIFSPKKLLSWMIKSISSFTMQHGQSFTVCLRQITMLRNMT